jgi:AraC family transcriptional regulator of adaptative response / DNA-3-methyladenine glycosylase II
MRLSQFIDAHLTNGGLAPLVARRPGLRTPGTFDGFEAAIRELLRRPGQAHSQADRLIEVLGELLLKTLGIPERRSEAIASMAADVADGKLHLEPGADVQTTLGTLKRIPGIGERSVTAIVVRALHWPDAFDPSDLSLQRAVGVSGSRALLRVAEQWRPWRAYAAAHLALQHP